MATNKPNKLAFLSMPAPASYVAGLGRSYCGGPSSTGEEQEVDPEQFQDPDNEYGLFEYGLFAGTTYEQDDEEADKIYDQVDAAMDARRKARSDLTQRIGKHENRRNLRNTRGLSSVTSEEWENIPEVGNLTRRKRRRDERSFVVPDNVVVGDRAKGEYENSLDPMRQETGGLVTPADSDSLTNFVEIGQARDKILSLKLDQVSGTSTASGLSTSIDPRGYLTSLDSASAMLKTSAEIGDIKQARMLFDSLIKSNPKHAPVGSPPPHTGRMVAARKTIMQGCEMCPNSEDVWLEAARLHVRLHTVLLMCVSDITMKNNNDAKVVLANAVQHVSQSVKIWLAAADLESDAKSKRRVLRKGGALHIAIIS
ncbi:Pre-mRNA-splicing factor prp [Salix suchowensis]|nr:Pre-mRNA-splicing factor prp [Salix suchowensis]